MSNAKVIQKIQERLETGNETFNKEMPVDGTYTIREAIEEALDLSIYLSAHLIYIEDRLHGTVKKLVDGAPEHEKKVIKDYLHRVIMKEKIKNKGHFGIGKVIVQFLEQEIGKLAWS